MIQRVTAYRIVLLLPKSALRRTALVPEKYDLPLILLDTSQGRINTVGKLWLVSKTCYNSLASTSVIRPLQAPWLSHK